MNIHVSKYAFIHAKMHGLMAKTYVDERLRFLLKITNLLDLSRALFPNRNSSGDDKMLVHDVQRKFQESVIEVLARLLSFFPKEPPLLVHVLREYEYRNLLTLLREKFSDVQNIRLWDIGKYGRLPPDVEHGFPRSLIKTPFEKYIARMDKTPLFELEFEIDKQYYEELNVCVTALPKGERDLVRPLLETEILLQNLLWALRLRFYFDMGFDEVEKLLFPLGFAAVVSQVRLLFELSLDAPKEWSRLRCGDIFMAERDGVIDPEAIEGRAIHYLYKKTRRHFYMFPFTLASVYAFFRIKTYEARLITSISEGIRMGMSADELAELIGVL